MIPCLSVMHTLYHRLSVCQDLFSHSLKVLLKTSFPIPFAGFVGNFFNFLSAGALLFGNHETAPIKPSTSARYAKNLGDNKSIIYSLGFSIPNYFSHYFPHIILLNSLMKFVHFFEHSIFHHFPRQSSQFL